MDKMFEIYHFPRVMCTLEYQTLGGYSDQPNHNSYRKITYTKTFDY